MRYLHHALSLLRWLLLGGTALAAGIAKSGTAPTWMPEPFCSIFPWTVANQWWLLPGPPVVAVACQWALSRLALRDREAQLQALLSDVLTTLRSRFIPATVREDPEVDHRLTLYCADRKQAKLRIFARSGEATRNSGTCWQIDPNDRNRCQGVAGVGWYLNSTMFVPERGEEPLPDISRESTSRDEESYAARTFVTCEDVRRNRWKARSFATLTVRVDGRRWGVLVLDSVDPEGANRRIVRKVEFAVDMIADIIRAWRRP